MACISSYLQLIEVVDWPICVTFDDRDDPYELGYSSYEFFKVSQQCTRCIASLMTFRETASVAQDMCLLSRLRIYNSEMHHYPSHSCGPICVFYLN